MKRLALLFTLSACLSTGLIAQSNTGIIEGTVLDPSGASVAKAKVTITNTDRNQVVRAISTDPNGIYSAPLIPIGNYSIKVEAPGFKTTTRTEIVLNVDDDLKINLTLALGSATETVEVRESAVAVELGTPASSTTIEGTPIRELA